MVNRILISSNTIFTSSITFSSRQTEKNFSMYRTLGSSDGSTIFKARYFKSASSQSWYSRHWVKLPQMEITRDRAKPPMKRRTYFEVGSKRWVTIFFEVYYPLREVFPAHFLMWHSALVSPD